MFGPIQPPDTTFQHNPPTLVEEVSLAAESERDPEESSFRDIVTILMYHERQLFQSEISSSTLDIFGGQIVILGLAAQINPSIELLSYEKHIYSYAEEAVISRYRNVPQLFEGGLNIDPEGRVDAYEDMMVLAMARLLQYNPDEPESVSKFLEISDALFGTNSAAFIIRDLDVGFIDPKFSSPGNIKVMRMYLDILTEISSRKTELNTSDPSYTELLRNIKEADSLIRNFEPYRNSFENQYEAIVDFEQTQNAPSPIFQVDRERMALVIADNNRYTTTDALAIITKAILNDDLRALEEGVSLPTWLFSELDGIENSSLSENRSQKDMLRRMTLHIAYYTARGCNIEEYDPIELAGTTHLPQLNQITDRDKSWFGYWSNLYPELSITGKDFDPVDYEQPYLTPEVSKRGVFSNLPSHPFWEPMAYGAPKENGGYEVKPKDGQG